ncbi:putative nuclease HARBI1 [Portunus trituberculatus]|uniref:Putative nuclease HARBI1 n=1 Tax=Portunus trituberculatus TaxID=210409 RepID=A0A5B7HIM7_PORTR|nr:putative nuclease HARBI1 [Portunus trituberculatus]
MVRYSLVGATHDAFVWTNSDLKQQFDRGQFGDFVLIGDSGYPLEPRLMVPIINPTTPAEELYNKSHAQTRVIVEQTNEILKNHFK